MATMRCAQLVEPGKPLEMAEMPVPEPPPRGIVVQTSFSGVCHSDIHAQDNKLDMGGGKVVRFTDFPNFKLPVVMGHEISGIVHSIGKETTEAEAGVCVGDRVCVYPWIGCCSPGCGMCRSGAGNLCPGLTNQIGFGPPGGYSTHVPVVEGRFAVKVPDSVPMDVASMLPCSGITAYHAVKLTREVVESMALAKGAATLLVIGAGGLGMWCIQLARAVLPASTLIIVADVSAEKLEAAIKHGADKTVLWDNQEEKELIARTRQAGANGQIDATIDFVNTPTTAGRANGCLVKGGVMVCVGLFGGAFTVALPSIVIQGRSIRGCYVGTLSDLRDLVQLIAEKKVTPPPMEYLRLDDASDALDRLRQGKVRGRGIIQFS